MVTFPANVIIQGEKIKLLQEKKKDNVLSKKVVTTFVVVVVVVVVLNFKQGFSLISAISLHL